MTTTQAFHTLDLYLNIDIFTDMYAKYNYTYEEIDNFYIYQNEFYRYVIITLFWIKL